MPKVLATVVIPIHLEEPSELEKISLAQTLAVLHRYPITFMTPAGLDTTWYEEYCQGKASISFERFKWQGYDAYSTLMTRSEFYQRFLAYEYILVCHLDAFVFRDELEKWCQLGYDFTGAVIYSQYWLTSSLLRRMTGFAFPEYFGNGGFGLKKVDSFYRITSRFKLYIELYHKVRKWKKKGFFDDLFVAQHFTKLSPGFKIPPKSLAQQFGANYESWQEQDLPFTNRELSSLPFGVHGWIQWHRDFWLPCIRQYGHNL